MKLKFLGTAAAEGVPALFCRCEVCEKARKLGGKRIRTRSQALINDDFLIDYNADSYMHFLTNNINAADIKNILITHNHSDHFYPIELTMKLKPFATDENPYKLTVYASSAASKEMSLPLYYGRNQDVLDSVTIEEYTPVKIDNYTVTPLKAIHGLETGPFIYLIEEEGKTLFYAHDTHYPDESVWKYFEENKIHLDLVSLDCTNCEAPSTYIGHMGLYENIEVKERLLKMGCADEKTIFVCNHFSHNGKNADYEDFKAIAEKHGFLTSYDGMEIEI